MGETSTRLRQLVDLDARVVEDRLEGALDELLPHGARVVAVRGLQAQRRDRVRQGPHRALRDL